MITQLQDELREQAQRILLLAREIGSVEEARRLSEEAVELAALALQLRGALMVPVQGAPHGYSY